MRVRNELNSIKKVEDLWLLLRIAAWSSFLPPLLRWMELPTLLRLLEPRIRRTPAAPEEIDKIVNLTNTVLKRNILAGTRTCLKRSLLLFHFLGKAGKETVIHFGVNPQNGFTGHSWLTSAGQVFLEDAEDVAEFGEVYSWGESR